MKIKPCKKICIPLIAAVFLLVVLAYITIPSIQKISSLSDQIFEERKKLEEIYQKGQSLKKSKKEYEQIKNQTKLLDDVFIIQTRELEFITELEKKSFDNNLTQDIQIDTKNLQKQKEIQKLPLEIHVQGAYFNILNYIQDIEALDLYFNIESLSFSKNGSPIELKKQNIKTLNQEENSIITADIKGYVYYYTGQE